MWDVTLIKFGTGSVGIFGFRNRAEAVAKRDELKAEYADGYSVMMEWSNQTFIMPQGLTYPEKSGAQPVDNMWISIFGVIGVSA